MLVVTRKERESISLNLNGTVVKVYVTRILGNQVRLGIEAPRAVDVIRDDAHDLTPKHLGNSASAPG